MTHAVLQVFTALSVGAASALALLPGGTPVLIALFAASMVGLVLYLLPRLIRWLTGKATKRLSMDMPSARGLSQSVALTLVPLGSSGVALHILAGDRLSTSLPATIAAFSAAWAIGFIALPLPSGVIVRESVLLLLLDIDLPDLVAVSLAHRTAALAAEFSLMALFAAGGAFVRRRR